MYRPPYKLITEISDFTIDATYQGAIVVMDTNVNNITATLPATSEDGDRYILKKTSGANLAIVDGNGKPINALSTFVFNADQETVTFIYSSVTDAWTIESHYSPVVDVIAQELLQNGLIYGGATWRELLIFDVSEVKFILNGAIYTAGPSTVTLSAADPTNSRIDVIVANTDGTISVVEGMPAPNPAKPEIDFDTQVEVTFIKILAAAITPDGLAGTDIYLENAGDPAEWNGSASAATGTIALGSTSDPQFGSISINATDVSDNDFIEFTTPSPINSSSTSVLELWIKSKGDWGNKRLRLAFFNGATQASNWVDISDGFQGFDTSSTSSYNLLTICSSTLNVNSSLIDTLRIEVKGSGPDIGFYIDNIRYVQGIVSNPASSSWVASDGTNSFDVAAGAQVQFISNDSSINIDASTPNTLNLELASGVNGNNIMNADLSQSADRTHLLNGNQQLFFDVTSSATFELLSAGLSQFLWQGNGVIQFGNPSANALVNSSQIVFFTTGGAIDMNNNGIDIDVGPTQDLTLSGDPGSAGQVITSQGPNLPPIWSSTGGNTHIMNTDLTSSGDRTQDLDGNTLAFTNNNGVSGVSIAGTTSTYVLSELAFQALSGNFLLTGSSGNTSTIQSTNVALNITHTDGATNTSRITLFDNEMQFSQSGGLYGFTSGGALTDEPPSDVLGNVKLMAYNSTTGYWKHILPSGIPTIYTANSVLSGDRTVNQDSNNLIFTNAPIFSVTGTVAGNTLSIGGSTGASTITSTNSITLTADDTVDQSLIELIAGTGAKIQDTGGVYIFGDGAGSGLPPTESSPTHVMSMTSNGVVERTTIADLTSLIAVGIDTNIGNTDQTLTGSRVLDLGDNYFEISGSGSSAQISIALDNSNLDFLGGPGNSVSFGRNIDGADYQEVVYVTNEFGLNFGTTTHLAINGDEGNAGQVLTSQGTELPPIWSAADNIYGSNGTISEDRTITVSGTDNQVTWNFANTTAQPSFVITNFSTGAALQASATGNTDVASFINNGGTGVALTARMDSQSTTNSTRTAASYAVTTTGTAASGFGVNLRFQAETDGGGTATIGYLDSYYTDATNTDVDGAFRLRLANSNNIENKLSLFGDTGILQLHDYGSGSITAGAPTYSLAVDGNGNVIEERYTKEIPVSVYDAGTDVTTSADTKVVPIPPSFDGMNLVDVIVTIYTLGSTSGAETIDVNIRRKRSGTGAIMLSSALSLSDTDYYQDIVGKSGGTIDTANDDVQTGDALSVTVVNNFNNTNARGMGVTLVFQNP